MIELMIVLIFATSVFFSILHVVDKDELIWSILAATGWLVLAAVSWSVEQVFARDTGSELAFQIHEYTGSVWLMWFFFAIAIVFVILAYQRAMYLYNKYSR